MSLPNEICNHDLFLLFNSAPCTACIHFLDFFCSLLNSAPCTVPHVYPVLYLCFTVFSEPCFQFAQSSLYSMFILFISEPSYIAMISLCSAPCTPCFPVLSLFTVSKLCFQFAQHSSIYSMSICTLSVSRLYFQFAQLSCMYSTPCLPCTPFVYGF